MIDTYSPSSTERSSLELEWDDTLLGNKRSRRSVDLGLRFQYLVKRYLWLIVLITLNAIVLILIASRQPRETSYRQWARTKLGREDPFDDTSALGRGVGPVEMKSWGLHEDQGWDMEGVRLEKGLLVLDEDDSILFRPTYGHTEQDLLG